MADKKEDKGIERIYVIPLRKIKRGKSSNAAPKAIKHVRSYLTRHMKVDGDAIWIDGSLNTELWSRGKYKIPSKIRIRAVKFEDGVVEVSLPELGYKKSRREILKEEREKKEPILRREEADMEDEDGGIAGAEDYDVVPTADGEVKIKKKKAPKPKAKKKETKAKPKKSSAKKKTTTTKKTKKKSTTTKKTTKPKKSSAKKK